MGLLAVVTVVRNDDEGLRRTLASLALQTVAPDEVLVLDGSDDPGLARASVREFPSLPITLEWREPRGVYPAMNEALTLVDSAYVYFLNAGDDLAGPQALADVMAVLRDEQPLWVVARVVFLQPDGRAVAEPPWSYAEERRRLFARGRFPAHQGVIASTAALRELGGFDTSYRVAADYALILRLARRADPVVLPSPIARFRVGGLSTTHWRIGLEEFHRARLAAFAPTGRARALEQADTVQRWAATTAYRSLWGPGRPLSGVAARIRSRGGSIE